MLEVTRPGEPEVTYIESWPADRSIKEIVASNLERQKAEDEQEAKIREAYKALGRASGMDVDRIEREAEAARAEKTKKAAAAAAKAAAATGAQQSSCGCNLRRRHCNQACETTITLPERDSKTCLAL